jgi:uncharacterized protein Yka (UPF0111/DUF47 family)
MEPITSLFTLTKIAELISIIIGSLLSIIITNNIYNCNKEIQYSEEDIPKKYIKLNNKLYSSSVDIVLRVISMDNLCFPQQTTFSTGNSPIKNRSFSENDIGIIR